MGAGILPTTIYKNKLYFLFGKENQFEDSAKGFSDFGGGTDNKEDFLDTAAREASEELTGFLGSSDEIRTLLDKSGVYTIDYKSPEHSVYRMHIFPFAYNECLPYYYNNNQRFIQKHLGSSIIKKSKIFEKAEIAWFSIDEMMKRKTEFRSYFQNIIEIMFAQREKIRSFIQSSKSVLSKRNGSCKAHFNSVSIFGPTKNKRITRRYGKRTRRRRHKH